MGLGLTSAEAHAGYFAEVADALSKANGQSTTFWGSATSRTSSRVTPCSSRLFAPQEVPVVRATILGMP